MVIKNRKDILLLITEMELKLSAKFVYPDNINTWPLFKIQIAYLITLIYEDKLNAAEGKLEYKQPGFQTSDVFNVAVGFFRNIKSKIKYKDKLKNKVLIFGFKEHFYKNREQDVNLYTTPFKNELDKQGIPNVGLIVSNKSSKISGNELYNLFERIHSYYKSLFSLKDNFNSFSKKAYSNARMVKDFLEHNNIRHASYIANILYRIQLEQQIKFAAFRHLLAVTNPGLIWSYCYYDNTVMALNRAANELSIPNVEYQHSVQSDEHHAYSKWERSDRYKFLFPSVFWVWKHQDKDRLIRNFSSANYVPNVVVGGNLSVLQQKEALRVKNTKSKNGVLISLQGHWIPSFIEKVIEKDNSCKWYFRLHPRYGNDAPKLQEFKKRHGDKIEMEEANSLTLYELFSQVQVSVTDFSGVALEAEGFGLNNIIIGNRGAEVFKQEINEGVFYLASDEEQFSETLYQIMEKPVKYIETIDNQRERVNHIISELLKNASVSKN